MPLFQVVNRKTHSRAVVVASTERRAREMRPDGAVWRNERWQVYDHKISDFRIVPDLPEWPVGPEHAHADLLAQHVVSRYDVENVLAFEATTTPRLPGEGPDEWWEPED